MPTVNATSTFSCCILFNIPSIFCFAPEIMLCRLRVLPYRLSIPDYRLLIHYYRFRILLYPSQTTVADPCLPSYILNPSIVLDNLAPCLTTGATSLRKKDIYYNLESYLTTGATSFRKKDVYYNLALCLTTDSTSLRKKDVLDYTTNSFDLFFYDHPFVTYLLILSQPSLLLQIS